MPFTPPHLPVLNELDNTRNWEALRQAITSIEEGSGGGKTGFTNTQIAIAYRAAAQELKGATAEKIELDTVLYDPGSLIKAGSYKVAIDGVYQVSGQVAAPATEAKEVLVGSIYVNTIEKVRGTYLSPATEAVTFASSVAGMVKCKAGDAIELWGLKNGKKLPLETKEYNNRLSVFRVPPEVAEVEGVAGGDLQGTYPNPTLSTEIKEKLADSGWLAVSFENSWKNTGGEFLTAAYRKQGNTVRLRGLIEGGAAESTAFTLPAGYRPTAVLIAPGAGAEVKAANVRVTAAGLVKPNYTTVGKVVGLDGVTFTVD